MSSNGQLSDSELVTVDEWARLTPATAAAFLAAAAYILLHFNARPAITKPYGAYRDLAMQRLVKTIYGILAATPGYSNHGLGIAFDMNNVTTIARAVGGIAALDQIMARFGFYRNASNGSGGIEEWHYTLVAVVDLAALSDAQLIDPTQPLKESEMKSTFIAASATASWWMTDGLTKRAMAPGEPDLMVAMGVAAFPTDADGSKKNGVGVSIVGQSFIDRIPTAQ